MATETLRPNDTILNTFSLFPNTGEEAHEDVDDVTSDEDSTYLYHNGSGSKSCTLRLENSSIGGGTISSVVFHAMVKADSVLCGGYLGGGVEGESGLTYHWSTSPGDINTWVEKTSTLATNPDTGVAWTWANIDALDIFFSGAPAIGSGLIEVTQLWVVVNYTVTPPTVTQSKPSDIRGSVATGHGNITSLGVPNPTQHGHCWNSTGTPTTSDSKTQNGAASATGAFTSSMTGLVRGRRYYVRAYATNAGGTSYSSEWTFIAGGGGRNIAVGGSL